jgi:cell division protein FtsI (penicillin-binding protein 3)
MSERWQIDRIAGATGPRRRRGRGFGPYMPPRLDEDVRRALETGRARMLVAGFFMMLAFAMVGGRLTQLATLGESEQQRPVAHRTADKPLQPRADIVDRNGEVLATDLPTASLYANARRLLDPEEAARGLVTVLPDLDYAKTLKKLRSDRTFVWLRRNLTPREQLEVTALGIPGLDFIPEYTRVYPHGPLLGHLLGYVDSDNTGIAGLEKRFDGRLAGTDAALRLTVDLRVQHVMREELRSAMLAFRAKAAAGVVLDTRNGEVVALVSLPDFDPNHPGKARDAARFNRATLGVYELGSTFKVFTAAMALDSGVAGMGGRYDATRPLKVAQFTIRDYHPKRRWLSLPEVFVYSSNIGAALIARDIGGARQQDYLRRLGMLDPLPLEIPETGRPIVPSPWRPVNTMTIGFGHGLAVSPLHLASGVAAVANGGVVHEPTLIGGRPAGTRPAGRRVFSDATSLQLRKLMRLTVLSGTGRRAEVAGYPVGGKTGTAEKPGREGYAGKSLVSSFVAVFPITEPRYVVLAMLDEPRGNESTNGNATGGRVAAPVVGNVIGRIAPMLGIAPMAADSPELQELHLDMTTEGRKLASY